MKMSKVGSGLAAHKARSTASVHKNVQGTRNALRRHRLAGQVRGTRNALRRLRLAGQFRGTRKALRSLLLAGQVRATNNEEMPLNYSGDT